MELIGLNVLEVEQIKLKKASPAANGVTRDQVVARVKVEGGVLQIPVADMVDIPEGWSGKAICSGQVISYTRVWNGQGNTRFAVEPVRIEKFNKIAQVKREDILNSFFAPPANASDGQQGKPAEMKGQQR
ncbi:hypothetical protein [Victivallis vadensis]|uniref:hypothetical protein n=1 Tax=Victivallis vadensis TaxID=172901 RepID=UPI0023F8B826|nr:hypothetical protein [Victivallis vadensis]